MTWAVRPAERTWLRAITPCWSSASSLSNGGTSNVIYLGLRCFEASAAGACNLWTEGATCAGKALRPLSGRIRCPIGHRILPDNGTDGDGGADWRQRTTRKEAGSRSGRGAGGAAARPTPTAPIGSQSSGRSSAAAATGPQNSVLDTQHEPSPSTASATRRFCTPAPIATRNIARSAALRRGSGYTWAASATRQGTIIKGA